jgi:hypothetical protein
LAIVRCCLALPTLPAGSASEASTVHEPLPTAEFGVTFQVPLVCSSVVIVCPPIETVTVVAGAAFEVPAMVGSTLFVVAVAPPAIVMSGATVSTVRIWVKLAMFPASSDTDMMMRWVPSASAAAVTDQVPPGATRPVSVWSARFTVTGVPGATSLVPEIFGVGSLVVTAEPPSSVSEGGTVSIVSCWVALPVFPAPSTTEAVTG